MTWILLVPNLNIIAYVEVEIFRYQICAFMFNLELLLLWNFLVACREKTILLKLKLCLIDRLVRLVLYCIPAVYSLILGQ